MTHLKLIIILLSILFLFQLKVSADVDGIPDGVYKGEAKMFTKEKTSDGEIVDKEIESQLAIVVGSERITGVLLIDPPDKISGSGISVGQSISINKISASTTVENGTTTFAYDQKNKIINFDAIDNIDIEKLKEAEPVIFKLIGKAKLLDDEPSSLESYTENISNDCNGVHFLHIGSGGYIVAQLPIGLAKPTFFGKIANQDGDFKTIYSESQVFHMDPKKSKKKESPYKVFSIINKEEKIIVHGAYVNVLEDEKIPFEIDFLKTKCERKDEKKEEINDEKKLKKLI